MAGGARPFQWDGLPRLIPLCAINDGKGEAIVFARLRRPGIGDNLAPWSHTQAVAIGRPTIGMGTGLRRSQYVAAALYGACAQQNMPVCLACWNGESRWYGDYFCPRINQGAKHFAKA